MHTKAADERLAAAGPSAGAASRTSSSEPRRHRRTTALEMAYKTAYAYATGTRAAAQRWRRRRDPQ